MKLTEALVCATAFALSGAAPIFGSAAEGGGCDQATAGATVARGGMVGGEVVANGTWESGGGATGVLLEYRIDSDRYFAETRLGSRGEWAARFPYELCGDHRLRVFAFPLVGAGEHRTVCLGASRSAVAPFQNHCGTVPSFACEWRCEGAECTGSCSAAVSGGEGPFTLMVNSGRSGFREAAPAGPGPFEFEVRCRAGDAVRLRARGGAANRGFSPAVELKCGG